MAEEAFANIRTVKAFATEEIECASFAKMNDAVYETGKKAAIYYGLFNFSTELIIFGSIDALVFFASYLIQNDNTFSIGKFT